MAAVSTTPSARQMSHAGKYEPRMSNEGAREQLVISDDASKSATAFVRKLLLCGFLCATSVFFVSLWLTDSQ